MINRTLFKPLSEIARSFPVLLLTGPRQVGKTTLLSMVASAEINYVSLDNLQDRQLAISDPALFLQNYSWPLIIDEVQYAPQLFSYIKILVDKHNKPGMFWLTGSQKYHLMQGISESLAGRVAIIDLLGLSQAEIADRAYSVQPFLPTTEWILQARQDLLNSPNQGDIFQRIWNGSFPRLIADQNMSRDIFYNSYLQTYIQRDVRDILNISNEISFTNFMRAIAARSGRLLNYSDLARDADIDHKTAKKWLSILEASGLVYLLQPYYKNINKRMVKTPKLYFLDTGLCAYLTQWPTAESLRSGAMSVEILETYVFSEIIKSYWHNAKQPYIYYYRDTDQQEIDLLIETGEGFYPIEIKKTASPNSKMIGSFEVLRKFDKPILQGALLCLIEKDIPIKKDISAIPIDYL